MLIKRSQDVLLILHSYIYNTNQKLSPLTPSGKNEKDKIILTTNGGKLEREREYPDEQGENMGVTTSLGVVGCCQTIQILQVPAIISAQGHQRLFLATDNHKL